jgi:C4-dicarboxylate transporter, DctQ subunit
MTAALQWLRARAENVAAAMLAALFIAFLLQIFSRYVISMPLGWTVELCLTLWLWLTFWCGAFVLEEREHVRFDSLYNAARPRAQRIMALISAVAVGGSLLLALPATWDYVSFYKIKRSPSLGWRLDLVFSVYLMFAVAAIVVSAWRIKTLFWPTPRDETAP